MPKSISDHVITVRLHNNHLVNYNKNKTFTLQPDHINDDNNIEARLHFKAKKHLTKLIKNVNKNSGTRINPDDLKDIQVHVGSGLFDSLKSVMSNPIAKTVLKAAMPIASNLVGQQIKNFTGSDALANASKSLMKDGTNELTSGSGFNFNDILKSKITKGIVKAALPTVANLASQQVKNFTGSDALAGVSKSLINEGGKEMTAGSGMKRVSGLKRGGSFLPLGAGVNQTPMQIKMANLRAMRKK
jgi:hypothetical protein